MESLSIHTTLTLADWHALQRACMLRMQQQDGSSTAWRVGAFWLVITFAGFALLDALGIGLQPLSMLVGLVFCAIVMTVAYQRSARSAQPRAGDMFFSPGTHEIGPEGIASTQPAVRSFVQWQQVADVTATAEHIFIWLDTLMAYVIPVRDLPPDVTAEQVVAACKQWMMAAPAAQEPVLPPSNADAAVDVQAAPPVIDKGESAWKTVFRLLTLRSVEHPGRPGNALSGKPLPIVVLALVSFALWAGLTRFYYVPQPKFFPYSAPALSWYVLAMLAVAVTMAKRSRPQVALSQVCSLLAIVLPIMVVADFAIVMGVPEQWTDVAHAVLALYAIVYCARGMHALTGDRQPLAILGGTAVAAMFLWVGIELYVYPGLWTIEPAEEYAEELETDGNASEALLFEQPARIDASVAQIQRAADGAPAGFFVGFAGYGEQRVFAEEIKFAARKIAERYDTADRSLLLINDRRDRQAQPLATVAGLSYALKAIASKMRLDQDVLFLALSSHGSEDPLLSVENGALPLRDLTGDALAEALRASGIKWRVILISACHSGAFIKSLQNPYTIVITAASPDRTSFGCSDDRDLTYFGEAFFRDSFPQATSLRDAFDTATKLVTERESEEGYEASHPQAFFGEQIEPRLATMLRAASSP